jgi:hypothetical protein
MYSRSILPFQTGNVKHEVRTGTITVPAGDFVVVNKYKNGGL